MLPYQPTYYPFVDFGNGYFRFLSIKGFLEKIIDPVCLPGLILSSIG
jgi:hypothetical protein